jgi:hypothetical protein
MIQGCHVACLAMLTLPGTERLRGDKAIIASWPSACMSSIGREPPHLRFIPRGSYSASLPPRPAVCFVSRPRQKASADGVSVMDGDGHGVLAHRPHLHNTHNIVARSLVHGVLVPVEEVPVSSRYIRGQGRQDLLLRLIGPGRAEDFSGKSSRFVFEFCGSDWARAADGDMHSTMRRPRVA